MKKTDTIMSKVATITLAVFMIALCLGYWAGKSANIPSGTMDLDGVDAFLMLNGLVLAYYAYTSVKELREKEA